MDVNAELAELEELRKESAEANRHFHRCAAQCNEIEMIKMNTQAQMLCTGFKIM